MSDRLAEIQRAIDSFQMDAARAWLREELRDNPSAAAYYLASQAALNHGQRVEFLERALELDPQHHRARAELDEIVAAHHIDALPPRKAKPVDEAASTVPATPAVPRRRLASPGKRWLAIVIDGIIVFIPTMLLLSTFGSMAALESAMQMQMQIADEELLAAAFSQFQSDVFLINLLVSAVYNLTFMTLFKGQTLGKMMLGLRAVKKNGADFTLLDALVRNVIGYTLSNLFLMLGFIWALFDRESQAWHDKLAGTVVIDERASERAASRINNAIMEE